MIRRQMPRAAGLIRLGAERPLGRREPGIEDFFRLVVFFDAPNSPTYFHRLTSEAPQRDDGYLLRANLQAAPYPTVLEFQPGNFEHPETAGYEVHSRDLPALKAPDRA